MQKQRHNSAARSLGFATMRIQSLYFLIPKFQTSSHLLRLYSRVCVRPGRKPKRYVLSRRDTVRNMRDSAIYAAKDITDFEHAGRASKRFLIETVLFIYIILYINQYVTIEI